MEALERVKMRNDFYRDNFRRMVWVLLLSLLINLVLLCVFIFMATKSTKVVYFATTTDGQLVRMQNRSVPVMSAAAIRGWVTRNVPEIYSMNFMNYRRQLQTIRGLFTSIGWKEFLHGFGSTVSKVRDQKLIMTAVASNVPVIIRSGVFDGIYSWQIQVPLTVTFQKGDKAQSQNIVLQMILQRVNNTDSNQLVGITQIVERIQPKKASK